MKIEIGDKVKVVLVNGKEIDGVVNYIPGSSFDSWVIDLPEYNTVVYIQQFSHIYLIEKHA